jgi:hypothetical protein
MLYHDTESGWNSIWDWDKIDVSEDNTIDGMW